MCVSVSVCESICISLYIYIYIVYIRVFAYMCVCIFVVACAFLLCVVCVCVCLWVWVWVGSVPKALEAQGLPTLGKHTHRAMNSTGACCTQEAHVSLGVYIVGNRQAYINICYIYI